MFRMFSRIIHLTGINCNFPTKRWKYTKKSHACLCILSSKATKRLCLTILFVRFYSATGCEWNIPHTLRRICIVQIFILWYVEYVYFSLDVLNSEMLLIYPYSKPKLLYGSFPITTQITEVNDITKIQGTFNSVITQL